MPATKFEFEQRFWIFGLIIFLGFGLSSIDRVNFAVALLHLIAPSIDPDSAHGNNWLRLIFALGALLIFLSAFLRTCATAYLHTEIVHDKSQHSESLVADGPYRYLRNPLYFANVPMMAGIGFLASRTGWFFIVLSTLLFGYRLILREEDGLLQTQGPSYQTYLKAVPRFWPALSPRVPAGGGHPHWGQAILGELLFWLFGVAILSFALTLNKKIMGIVFAFSFAFYFLVLPSLVKRASKSNLATPTIP
jgi:protein-S-isoprenylcysteine O-methyltransferase Ste14